MSEHASIHSVRVRTPSRTVSLPWQSAQDFVARALAAYPTVHPIVEQFRARGISRPVELKDPNEMTFALAVIEARAAHRRGRPPAGDRRTSRGPSRGTTD
jgi:hypothetical protein